MAKSKEASLDFFNSIKTGNKYADGEVDLSTNKWFDTGSYAFNAILSGDMNKGMPNNRVTMLAGGESVGKSFLAGYALARPAAQEGYFTYYIDAEGSVGDENIMKYGLKRGQFKVIPEDIVENVKSTMNSIINQIEAKQGNGVDNTLKCAFILDSQGQLDTNKSRSDLNDGKEKADLTFQKELKKMYKTVVTRMAVLKIPFVVIAHIYKDNITPFIKKTVVAGGQGGLYGASNIVLLTKKQYKEGSIRKGTLLNAKIVKSRTCIDGIEAPIYLNFEKGLNRWYGLHTFAENAGLIALHRGTKTEEKQGIIIPDRLKESSEAGKSLKKPKDIWVIKDPKKEPKDWIVCKDTELHKKSTIGTIFDEINEWVGNNFKLTDPVDFDYDDWEEDIDEASEASNETNETIETKTEPDNEPDVEPDVEPDAETKPEETTTINKKGFKKNK